MQGTRNAPENTEYSRFSTKISEIYTRLALKTRDLRNIRRGSNVMFILSSLGGQVGGGHVQ